MMVAAIETRQTRVLVLFSVAIGEVISIGVVADVKLGRSWVVLRF
jgi:hypothetical protein